MTHQNFCSILLSKSRSKGGGHTINPTYQINALSPLADPVVGAIFTSVEEAGLAAESILRAILKSDNNTQLSGKIVRVTPQHYHMDPINRGCKIDVEVETDANERIIFEVQTSQDASIMKRDLFSTSHIMLETSNKGDSPYQMSAKMPKVIAINILTYTIRKNHNDIVQPFKILYTKAPHDIAIQNFSGYNVQLPKVLEVPKDFDNDLYCWCYTLYTAHLQGKTIKEVLTMTPELQTYAQQDEGYQQFCQLYDRVAADSKTRNEYVRWVLTLMREEGMKEAALEEGLDKGRAEGRKEGRAENFQAVTQALKLIQQNYEVEDINKITGLSFEEINSLRTSLNI